LLDIPTGATIVCAFGLALVAVWVATAWRRVVSRAVPDREVGVTPPV
jgi:hypothetical protein